MKTLIISILLLLSVNLFAQNPGRLPYKTVIQYAGGDTIKTQLETDTVRVTTNQNAFKFNKPIYVNGTQLGGGGSGTVYANNGLMMNGDTVILGNSSPMYYPLIVKNELGNWQNILQMSNSGAELLSYRLPTYELMSISMFNRNQGNPYIQLLHSRDNKSFIAKFDSSGIQYEGIDTTLTTPNHLMTEAQVKREIAAAIRASGGYYMLNSDTARYISKSQARKDIHDSIAPLREDVRALQSENLLGYYPIPANDTIRVSVGNIFQDDGIFIPRFVLKDSLGHKHLGENLNILTDINAIYIDYGKNITNSSINFSQSFQIDIDLETIYWVIINRNSYRLFLKYFKNTITNQL